MYTNVCIYVASVLGIQLLTVNYVYTCTSKLFSNKKYLIVICTSKMFRILLYYEVAAIYIYILLHTYSHISGT